MIQFQRTARWVSTVALLLFSVGAALAQDTETPSKPRPPRDMFEQMQLQMQQMMQQFNHFNRLPDDMDSSSGDMRKGFSFRMDTTFNLGDGMGQGGFQSFQFFNNGNGWQKMPGDSLQMDDRDGMNGMGMGRMPNMEELMQQFQQMMPRMAPDTEDPNADRPTPPKPRKEQRGSKEADKKRTKSYQTESL
jgi:hypothetical protein